MSGTTAVFVSDVHLYHGGEAYLQTFLRFLESVGRSTRALYIHGDLFDFYTGPRQGRLAFYGPLFTALAGLVDAGVRVGVQRGNRDFLVGRRFEEVGVALLPDEVVLELEGLRIHLSHGDQFCLHDLSYLFWARGVLRTAPVRLVVRNLPVGVGIWLARRYRAVSERKKGRMSAETAGRLPSILDGVRRLLGRQPFDAVVCGHIHQLADTHLEVGGRRTRLLTTGAWEEGPNYVELSEGELHLRRFEPLARAVAAPGPPGEPPPSGRPAGGP